MKKSWLYFVELLLFIGIGVLSYMLLQKDSEINEDAIKFSEEYELADKDNVFTYRSSKEIINILEHGTGVVYLGFPECPWCKKYVTFLNEVAKKKNLEKIYYFNILEARKDNTDEYKKIVEILGDNLPYDDEGNRRVYVPDVTFVVKGEIIGHDNETSLINDKELTPDKYWDEDKTNILKEKLATYMDQIILEGCSDCNK